MGVGEDLPGQQKKKKIAASGGKKIPSFRQKDVEKQLEPPQKNGGSTLKKVRWGARLTSSG